MSSVGIPPLPVAVAGASAVVNLVGILYQRGARTFERIHVEGAATVAKAAAAAGAKRFVQMSAIGADPDSLAEYGRTKAAGEAAVQAAFPGASIVNNLTVKAPALPAACATLGQTITDALNAHPLTFGVDSSALNPDQVAALNTLGATMKGCVGVPGGPTAVAVAGHTEAGGVNDPLSIARAEAVKAVLVSAGVPAAAITTSGVGAVDQAAPNTSDAGRAANRRVTISVK